MGSTSRAGEERCVQMSQADYPAGQGSRLVTFQSSNTWGTSCSITFKMVDPSPQSTANPHRLLFHFVNFKNIDHQKFELRISIFTKRTTYYSNKTNYGKKDLLNIMDLNFFSNKNLPDGAYLSLEKCGLTSGSIEKLVAK